MVLSVKFKESIKTALAMVIAYWVALAMDWDKPMWAALVVALISLATVGQSLNKGAMRMLGTCVGVLVAFTLIALFAEYRWLFMVFLSAWVALCTYLMGGSRNQYFWQVGGLVCVIVALEGGLDASNAFQTAMLRAQETGLGMLAYSLVAIFLWPVNTRGAFNDAVCGLASTQHALYTAYLRLLHGEDGAEAAQALAAQEIQQQARFSQLLDAAESDTYEVWEIRRQWRRMQRQSAEFSATLERWRDGFVDVRALDLQRLLPEVTAFGAELEGRLEQIERMLVNQSPERQPAAVELSVNRTELRALPHFEAAALAAARNRLQQLERLTRALFDTVSDIKGFGHAGVPAFADLPSPASFALDPDRTTSAIKVVATLWLAYFGWIYVDGLPGGVVFMIMATALGMTMSSMPQISVWKLLQPAAVGILFAALVYMLVMPGLSSFASLALLIFTANFAICYLYADPRQALGRTFGLAMFAVITSIDNQQTYSFLSIANTALMFPLVFVLLTFTAYIPVSPRPERAFLRLLTRFFRSCEFLTSALHSDSRRSGFRVNFFKTAFHLHEVSTLPDKLGTWIPHIDSGVLAETSPEQLQSLTIRLQVLGNHMQVLLVACDAPQAPLLVRELHEDMRAWHLGVQSALQRLSDDPTPTAQESIRAGLATFMERIEERIRGTLDNATERLSDQDGENFYGLLGAYRSVSEALVDYAENAGAIQWDRWREARF